MVFTEIRQQLIESLRKEMIGPHYNEDGRAILQEYPYNRYFTGILSPNKVQIEETENEQLSVEGGDDPEGQATGTGSKQNLQKFVKQSSFGMTFVIDENDIEDLEIIFSGGYYVPLEGEEERYEFIPFTYTYGIPNVPKRKNIDLQLVKKEFERGDTPKEMISTINFEELPAIKAVGLLRRNQNLVMITIAISNKMRKSAIQNYVFSSQLVVRSVSEQPIFRDRREWIDMGNTFRQKAEDLSLQFLHRKLNDIAVGHGVAVKWDLKQQPTSIESNFIPAHEVIPIVPRKFEKEQLIKMDFLAEKKGVDHLHEFLEGYKAWYNKLKEKLDQVEEKYRGIAKIHLKEIKYAINRIEGSINEIEAKPQVGQAFRLMNKVISTMRQSPAIEDQVRQWRPFQLAFILYSLKGLANPSSKSRNEVDLLWFPTGGGKTEAYLGLMAFIILLRRLRDPQLGAGTAVISRYTLRLLTLQQYQRTTTLVCALELLRQDMTELGQPFSIGLWVGNRTTPKDIKDAKNSLNEQTYAGTASMKQFQECPWCETPITSNSYVEFAEERSDAKIQCINQDCPFEKGLPAYLVDEQIFDFTPSIILGTVDKFARVPQIEEPHRFLGNTEFKSPDLIVQDELHLINGPLGSMYGLYEMMVQGIIADYDFDHLPKLISSTATVKRASEHIKRLYGRPGKVFPPVGFEAGDSYWAIPADEEQPGRIYLGIHPQGKSPTNALKAVVAQMLAKPHNLKSEYSLSELDPYWTLVGYFSSLRELGAAMMLAVDVIPDRIQQLADLPEYEDIRELHKPEELTSRLHSEEIAQMLDQLNITLDQPDKKPIDSIFATNMISVGVDVSRLSSMVVVGQPKSTAEYIQATARVGRKYPGLVVTLYNWTRPRDRSHYEKFLYYHSTLNTHVDPLSATPFSLQARERGLHAAVIGIIRHSFENMNKDNAAGKLDLEDEKVKQVKEFIQKWIMGADPDESDDVYNKVMELLDEWDTMIMKFKGKVTYSVSAKKSYATDISEPNGLMVPMDGQGKPNSYPKRTPNSLRNVEHSADFYVVPPKKERRRGGRS